MLVHWIWLATRLGLREQISVSMLQTFGDIEAIYAAQADDYCRIPEIRPKEIEVLCDKSMAQAEQILATCRMYGIHIVTFRDAAYPDRLRNIPDPPMVLYYKGCLPVFDDEAAIGVVGTRQPSAYGCQTAQKMGFQISRCGGLVVSGMAVGVDSMATNGALMSGASAVGVLACGADIYYPSGSRELRRELEIRGCVLTEYPPGTHPSPRIFSKRNRIISGLCCGVLVVEAPKRSGALITARHAIEQGRNIYAVPGNIDAYSSAGCNALIATGAKSVSYAWDIMQDFETLFPNKVRHWVGGVNTAEVQQSAGSSARVRNVGFIPTKATVRSPMTMPEVGARSDEKKNKEIDNASEKTYSGRKEKKPELSGDEAVVFDLLTTNMKQVDEIIAQSGLPANQVLAALTMLEVKALVVRYPGKYYSLPG